MNNTYRISSRFVLAGGALISLAALPQSASAQLVNGYTRPGAVVSQGQQSPPTQQTVPMRAAPVVRGAVPVYSRAPVTGTTYGNGTVSVQQPVYGRGGGYYHNGNEGSGYGNRYGGNGYSGTGPVVTLREAPIYPANGYNYNNYNNYYPTGVGTSGRQPYLPPVGPGNGYFTHPIPPVGPANGFFSGQAPITGGDPPRLGGYYYGNYCAVGIPQYTYPSLYSVYQGFPQYVVGTNVIEIGTPYSPVYATPYLPFYTPVYQTNYNQNNYYVATEGRVEDLQAGGERAKEALQHAYPANSFQAAFADIAQAWTDGNINLLRRHLRDTDTRISVSLNGKYSYSIASGDFSQITRDALDRLNTVSFDFTRLRKAKNGDVTAYGTHVYRAVESGSAGGDAGTVPFDQGGSLDDQSSAQALGVEKTVYISYTLRRYGDEWDIVATDSADHELAAAN